jgi:tRNA-Thr(GGU) m(6)t(6)A37 methyltransferase TsaA
MGGSQETYTVYPIGHVRASEDGYQLEILEPYRPALRLLDRFSHVQVFFWFDQHDSDELRSVMQVDLPYADSMTAGVFACKAPLRPNLIGLTTCALLGVEEEAGIVRLAWIDAFDGTPVLDLKPYIPTSDRVRDVAVAPWCADWPEWMEDAAAYFAAHEVDFGA